MRKLDFIVFGTARSGTSAVGRYLSAVESIYCGQEVFTERRNHSELNSPEAFLAPQANNRNQTAIDAIQERGDRIKRYGNKFPEYFYRLDPILDELDGCPAIACVRDLRSIALSYSARAANVRDPWPAGRCGLYAVGDALMLIHVLNITQFASRIMVIPHKALLADWQAVMTRAVHHIDPAIEASFDEERLKVVEAFKRRAKKTSQLELSPVEENVLRKLEETALPEFLNRASPFTVDEVREELAAIAENTPRNPVRFLREMASMLPTQEGRDYFEQWRARARRTWKQLEAAATSEELQRDPAPPLAT